MSTTDDTHERRPNDTNLVDTVMDILLRASGLGDDTELARRLEGAVRRLCAGKAPASHGASTFRAIVHPEEGARPGRARLRVLSGALRDAQSLVLLPVGARVSAQPEPDAPDGERVVIEGAQPRDGDILGDAETPPQQSDMFSVDVAWTGEHALYPGRSYRIVSPAGNFSALVGKLKHKIDGSGEKVAASELHAGESGRVEIELDGNLVFDVAETGTPLSLLLFADEVDGDILGVGCIRFALRRASNIRWQELRLDKRQRANSKGQRPFVLWFTGLSGCGKSTVASLLEERLHRMGKHAYVLDGDNVRHGLCKDLGFTEADRVENLRRVTEVAKLMVDAGLIVLVSFISPFRAERQRARQLFEEGEFLEVFVDTPLEICEARDIKGLYAKARAGLIRNFTGIDSPYEPPENADIHLPGERMSPEEMTDLILRELNRRNLLEPEDNTAPRRSAAVTPGEN